MVADSRSQKAVTPAFKKGRYKHYKGNLYQALDLVRHSETDEWLVLYRPDYGDKKLWVRPYSMFFERVEVQGEIKRRFEFVGS